MKFLVDMGISPKTVALLRALGHDATHLQEQGLERLPDPAIMTKMRFSTKTASRASGFGNSMSRAINCKHWKARAGIWNANKSRRFWWNWRK